MITAINLTKNYGGFTALNNLNLSVQPGEIFCLLGQNGAGKTTTINLFLGFTKPTSGQTFINGKDSVGSKAVAYIPEVVMLYPQFTALENLDFFSKLAGFRYEKSQLMAFLSGVGLQTEAHHKRLENFSKGMRQKVGIAIALAKDATAIFMDEPTSGLDPKATDEFSAIAKNLGEQGKAVFMATHDIFNAVNIGTRIGIMRQGTLVHILNARDIDATALQKLYLQTI